MGRIYTARFANTAITAQQDIIALVAPATAVVVIHEIGIGNQTEVGDTEEEMLSLSWFSGATTVGSGGSVVTPTPHLILDAVAATTSRKNDTTIASAGTIVEHYSWEWNVRVPFERIWTPETRPVLSPSRRGTFNLTKTPADSVTLSAYIVFEEIG